MQVLIYLWVITTQAVYMSNRGEAPQVLAKGVYVGCHNGLMSDPWEKTARLRKRFTQPSFYRCCNCLILQRQN